MLNIAVKGSFDDCQALVKALFADRAFVDKVRLSGVNSINWGRIAAQIVYYFTAYSSVVTYPEPVNFVVPTGNFGDVFAGYAAKKMGLPVGKLVVATNQNDILHRTMTDGDYRPTQVAATVSPSMDIQVASNFERLLYDVMQKDAAALKIRMKEFAEEKAMRLSEGERAIIAEDFLSFAVGEQETLQEIKNHYEEFNSLIDPHTAVARVAARAMRRDSKLEGKTITLSTAHAAKFPDAVFKAASVKPSLLPGYDDLFNRKEFMDEAPVSEGAIKALITNRMKQA